MPNISEANQFPAVPLIEVSDLVLGGSETSGPNKALKPLTDRTFNNRARIQSIIDNSTNLIVGTDVQAWDADLTALAGITGTGLLRRTGDGAAAVVTAWVDPSVAGGRLSLVAGESYSVGEIVDANRVYYTPHTGSMISLRSGSEWRLVPFVESSASIATLAANTNHDVFVSLNGSSLAFELQPWTNDTTRSVALVRQDGVWSKSGELARRYVGSIRTTGAGKTENSQLRRFVFNADNRLDHILRRKPGVNSWNASGTAWRAANGDINNRVQVVCGLRDTLVDLLVIGVGAVNGQLGISINVVGTANNDYGIGQSSDTQTVTLVSGYREIPRVGFSFYQMVEKSQNGNSTFDGANTALSGTWQC